MLPAVPCEALSASKGVDNKKHSLGPLVFAVTEQSDTFMHHLLIPGENESLHSIACEGNVFSHILRKKVTILQEKKLQYYEIIICLYPL